MSGGAEEGTRRAYDLIAAHYDRFWGDRMTRHALRALGELVLPRLPLPVERDPRALDLCCGTGQLAAVLSARGWVVTGVDAAAPMLALARRHAPRARFVRADARELAGEAASAALGPEPFDICISAFDSLNHVLDAGGLVDVFAGVHSRLRPSGAFLFDLNTRRGFQQRFKGGFDLDDGELACHVEASFDAVAGIGRYVVTMRTVGRGTEGAEGKAEHGDRAVESGSAASRAPEAPPVGPIVLSQRCHAPNEVVALLSAAGFQGVAVHNAERELGMTGHVGRVFFTAWRPE